MGSNDPRYRSLFVESVHSVFQIFLPVSGGSARIYCNSIECRSDQKEKKKERKREMERHDQFEVETVRSGNWKVTIVYV